MGWSCRDRNRHRDQRAEDGREPVRPTPGRRLNGSQRPDSERRLYPLAEVENLSRLVIDTSALIHADRAGFLDALSASFEVIVPAGVWDELIRNAASPIRIARAAAPGKTGVWIETRTDSGMSGAPVDESVIRLAGALRLPLGSDDFALLGRALDRGQRAYPSLVLIEALLLRGALSVASHGQCRSSLLDLVRYPGPIYRECQYLHWEIRKSM